MTHLLDTSAFLAFFFGEPGKEEVAALFVFADKRVSVGISVLSAGEFWARLKTEGAEGVFWTEWDAHLPLFDRVFPVDRWIGRFARWPSACGRRRVPGCR